MNILILNWRDPKNLKAGGAEISLFEHVKYWRKKGAQIIWFSAFDKNLKKEETIAGIKVIRKGSAYTVHIWAFFSYITKRLGNPDIVVDSFHFIPFFSILYMKKKEKIVGLINEIAGKLWFSNILAPLALIGYVCEPLFIKLYRKNKFITGSDSAKEALLKIGIAQDKIFVVNHGVHIYKTSSSIKKARKPTILFLGRVEKDKGINDALEALRYIKKEIPSAVLWVVGKEEKEATLNTLLESKYKAIRESVYYQGFVDEEKKFQLLKQALLLIHPSVKEGWGLTVIEAASQGVPTVGYNVEGLRDSVQNGKTGILVQPKNPKLLANAITHLIGDKKLYNTLSKNAQQWSKNFDWNVSVKKSWNVICQVYEEKK